MRRYIHWTVLTALVIGLAACGNAPQAEGEAQAGGNEATAAAPAAPAAPSAAEQEYTRLTANWSDEARSRCGGALRDALGTRDLVQGALAGVKDPAGRATAEIEDAKHWIAQGNGELDRIRPRLQDGVCDADVAAALQQAWQYYVKAGTAATQAKTIAGT